MITGFLAILPAVFNSSPTGKYSGGNIKPPCRFSGSLPADFRKPSFHNRGYTLIELVLVIVLLGLIFGITMPKLRQALLSDALDSTALKLIGLVQDLRERAISSQVSYTLHLDIARNRVWFLAGDATEEEQEAARERAYELPDDVRVEDVWSWRSGTFYNEAEILISRKGYIEQSLIHLQSDDGREISLELSPFLGSVKVHEGYVEIDKK